MTSQRSKTTSIAVLLAWIASPGITGAEDRPKDAAPYVLLVSEGDETVQAIFDRYPELSGSWEELARFNLLRRGEAIEVPAEMLDSPGTLAKIATFYGEAEVKRSFDSRFVPLVPNLLLREGDEIRTWRGAGARILFEDETPSCSRARAGRRWFLSERGTSRRLLICSSSSRKEASGPRWSTSSGDESRSRLRRRTPSSAERSFA
jgi:hypothetical protein